MLYQFDSLLETLLFSVAENALFVGLTLRTTHGLCHTALLKSCDQVTNDISETVHLNGVAVYSIILPLYLAQ